MSYSISDIVKNELCVGCGLCVSESSKSKMVWNDYGFLVPSLDSQFTENAINLCPFNPNPDNEVRDEDKIAELFLSESTHKDNRIGHYVNTYVGYSKEYRETSSSGGIATFVFEQLLRNKIVDHLYIVKEVEGSYAYQLFSDVNEIKKISKTRYIPVTLSELFKEIDNIKGKVALSGVACFIKAVRLKQYYKPELKEKIPFLVGIICGGLKSKFFTEFLVQKSGNFGQFHNQEYRVKKEAKYALDYSFTNLSINNNLFSLKMTTVGDMWGSGVFKAKACDFCTDVTTELADISLGDAWLEPYSKDGLGNSVIVTRSILADKLIRDGIKNEVLNVESLDFERFIASQQGSFNHRHLGLKFRVKMYKKHGGSVIPCVRMKYFKSISFDLKLVQRLRMQVRDKSLKVWRDTDNDVLKYSCSIKNDIEKLRVATSFNHRLRKLKKIVGLSK